MKLELRSVRIRFTEDAVIPRLFDLVGKKALITGGAVGVGRACATALAMSGVDVAIIGRSKEMGDRTCQILGGWGVNAFFVKCDVSDPIQVDQMTAEVIERLGRIDIAVNNAGGSVSKSALDLQRSDFDQILDTNLGGVFWCARAQARQMTRQAPVGGKIINIASMYGRIAGGNCAYNASKAGVIHLTKSLAAEWGAQNINVNCISPGWMLTPGNRSVTSDLRARMREVTPMGSLMRHQDIYGAVIYLASAASDFVTGHDLVVDGGHTINTWLTPFARSAPPRTAPEEEEAEMRQDLGDC